MRAVQSVFVLDCRRYASCRFARLALLRVFGSEIDVLRIEGTVIRFRPNARRFYGAAERGTEVQNERRKHFSPANLTRATCIGDIEVLLACLIIKWHGGVQTAMKLGSFGEAIG